jgi:hypothetical protein
VLKLTGFLSWQKALTFQTRSYCYWWKIITSGNFFFFKRTLVGWLSGSWTQMCWNRFCWCPLRLIRESLQLKASMNGKSGSYSIWIIVCHTLYNWGKARDAFQGGRVVRLIVAPTWLLSEGQHQLACWTLFHLGYTWGTTVSPRLAQVPAKLPKKGFHASANFESKLWISALTWLAKVKFSNPPQFACYQSSKVC